MKVFLNYDLDEIDRQYDAAATVPDLGVYIQRYTEVSARARQRFAGKLDLQYGPTRAEVLDVYPAETVDAPIHLFIHGGYWRRLSKNESCFMVETFVPAGATVVAVNYALAPKVSIDEIVRQNRAAIAWIYRHARDLGADPERIYISGHSAGGHLVGMMLSTDWEGEYGLPANLIKGACTISGVFDLEPLRFTRINAWAQLDVGAVLRNSPIHHLPEVGCPLIVSYGGLETKEFRRQSDEYAAKWSTHGFPCRTVDMPDFNHFTVVEELNNPESPLTRAVFEQMSL